MSVTGTTQSTLPADTTSSVNLGSPCQADADFKVLLNVETDVNERPRQSRVRKDSGYSEASRRPIYRLPSNDGSLIFFELQRSLHDSIRSKDLVSRTGHLSAKDKPNSLTKSVKHMRSEAQRKDNSSTIEPIRSHTQQQTSSTGSIDTLIKSSKSPRQSISIEQRTPAENCILVYAKSMSTLETLELSEYPISSSEPSRSPSPSRRASVSDDELGERCNPSAMASTIDLELHQSSPLHVATNVDWTSPSTRQRIYEKHDRDQQVIRRWIRKIIPRKLQGEQVHFYDGNSDAGSVRRYRLDIEQTSVKDTARAKTRPIRHVLSCLSLPRGT